MKRDVVIVGGGIGGAVLALALGRQGRRVVVLERELEPPPAGRPEILTQATLDTFDALGAGEEILAQAAIPLRALRVLHAKRGCLLEFTGADFKRANAQPYSTDPAATRQILLAASSRHAVAIERGVEVEDLWREGSRVLGVRARRNQEAVSWQAPLVVADDGGRSRIRPALGIPLRTRELPVEFLGVVGPELPGGEEAVGEAWLNPQGIRTRLFGAVLMPLPGRRTAAVFIASHTAIRRFDRSPAAFFEAAAELSPRCAELGKHLRFPDPFARFRRPFGHARRYVEDHVALMGDAAHPVTPAGGQGANMSVADAIALAQVAQAAFSAGDFSARRLSAYESLRRPANTRSLQFSARTDFVLRSLYAAPWLAALLLALFSRVNRNPATKSRLLRAISRSSVSANPPVAAS